QMFFHNDSFYRFCDCCRAAGITVPIIPGLKPITSARQIDLLPRSFHIDIPQELVSRLRQTTNADEAYRVGIEWSIMQSRDLLAHGVPAIHYYTMSKTDNVREIVSTVF
nr:methylenetetrahydrofolate reductase [Prevotella sp.]